MPFSIATQQGRQVLKLEGAVTIRHAQELAGGVSQNGLKREPQVDAHGAPILELKKVDPALVNYPVAFVALLVLMFYVTLVYGPMAAFLVELFPPQVRYTSISFPYHIGNGIFGGMLPLVTK